MRAWTLVLLLAALPKPGLTAVPAQSPALYREGEVIVKYRADALAVEAKRLKSDSGLIPLHTLLRGQAELLSLPGFTTTAAALEMLRHDPAVEYAEPNSLRFRRIVCPDNAVQFCPDDPLFGEQWGLRSIGQANFLSNDPALASVPGADMDMLAAWDPDGDGVFDRVGDGSVTVAIIDDSVSTTHPDLAANIVAGFNFVNNNSDPDPTPGSDQFHGTLVAGCVGAIGNNGEGVAGTAWNVKLMPLKFDFDVADHVAAMEFARDNGARIINASFGGPIFSQTEESAIADLAQTGILYVAAAGNDDSNTDFGMLNYPANHDIDNIVSVAATNRQDNIASFSQYGPLTVDVAAPGLQIVTTTNPGAPSPYSTNPGVSGTSFASPYTAGVAALLWSEYPLATFQEIKARLIEGAEPGAGGSANLRTSGGRLNAANSLNMTERPALVIQSVDWVDDNGALDPGEPLSVDITVQNLWVEATSVRGTLSADNGISVSSGEVPFGGGTVASQGTATARFDLTVPAGITDHRYVFFTLNLQADGYSVSRRFISEIGKLVADQTITQIFAPRDIDLYDEFHAWHFDLDALPAGHDQLVIETTAAADIDLLVKRGEPPRYNITVGIDNPETPGFFCTSGQAANNCQDPATFMSADADGNEQVVIGNPAAGSYHIVIVNFAQLPQGLPYTLRAYTRAAPRRGGSGGSLGTLMLLLLTMAAVCRALRPAKVHV